MRTDKVKVIIDKTIKKVKERKDRELGRKKEGEREKTE